MHLNYLDLLLGFTFAAAVGFGSSGRAADANPFANRQRVPPFPDGADVAQHGRADGTGRPSRQVRAVRLLDLLLHQLHAHPARAEEARTGVSRRSWWSSASTRRSSTTEAGREEHRRGDPPLPDRAPGGQRRRTTRSGTASACSAWPTRDLDRPRRLRRLGHERRDHLRAGRRGAQAGAALLPQAEAARRDAAAVRPRARTRPRPTPLRFPGKVLADEPGGRLFIADSNHNRIVVARLDGTLVATIGSGTAGRADGDFAAAEFNQPQGMALDGRRRSTWPTPRTT